MASHRLIEGVLLDFARHGSIVEIGSARETAGPECSTFYFKELSGRLEAEFYSVDFSQASHELAQSIVGDSAILSDGVEFLRRYPSTSGRPISILYLDNFDVVYSDRHRASLLRRVGDVYDDRHEELTNERSAIVHLEQIISAAPLLAPRNVVIIDDTKMTEHGWWGKGSLVVPFLQAAGYDIAAQSEDGVLLQSPR